VLDGRNRLRACRAAGVEPRFQTWDGRGSAIELVVSANLRRRHLNESQRAMLGAELKELLAKEALKRRGARTDLPANWQGSDFGEAAEKAALLTRSSARSIHRAARILRSGDRETVELVKKGELAVSAAAAQLREKSAPQRSPIDPSGPPFPILHAAPRWGRRSLEQLTALPVGEIASADALLFLRAPDEWLADAIKLIERWGFRYEGSLVWVWERARRRRFVWPQHEQVLIAVRGNPSGPAEYPWSVVRNSPRKELGPILKRMFPGRPKADLLVVSVSPAGTASETA
jgi:hypothetical protein